MMWHLLIALFALVALYAAPPAAHAQAPGYINQYNAVCDPKNPKNCVAPNSSGAVPVTGTISASSSEHSTAAPPTYVEGTDNALSGDLSGGLRVNCQTGCSGGTFNNNTDGVATSATNGQSAAWLYGFNGATFDRLRSDANKYLNIDIQTITAPIVLSASAAVIGHVIADSGSTTVVTGNVTVVQPTGINLHAVLDTTSTTAVTQATAANLNATVVGTGTFATQSTLAAGSAIAGKFGIDQTTPGTTNGVQVNAALPAGTNVIGHVINDASSAVIGHVIADTGSTTTVTGNVTVVQGTGTNLHAVIDSGSTTAVTQATASNLNATVVGTGTFATQSTLQAGAAIVGKVGIDQTTPGTTNGVSQNATTPISVTLQNAAVANGNGTVLTANGMAEAVLTVNCATCSGGTTVNFEGSEDASNFVALQAYQLTTSTIAGSTATAGVTVWAVNTLGLQQVRARVSGYSAGTITVTGRAIPAGNSIVANNNLAQLAGTATSVNNGAVDAGTLRVTIANNSTGQVALAAGSAVIGHVITDSGSTTVVTGSVTTTNAALALGQASTTSGQTGPLVQGAVTTSAPTYTTAQTDPLSLTTTGSLRVDLKDTASNTNNLNVAQATAANLNATVVQGTAANLKAQVSGASTPADAFALGTTSITVIDQNTVYNGSTSDLAREVANSTNSTGTGIPAAGQLGQCDDTSPTAITENSFGNARIDCASHAQLVTTVPSATAGGTTLFTLTLANTTNATNVKASAGQLYSISGFNMSSATPVWISLYNNSGTPTCGTAIIQQFLIPGNTTGSGFVYPFPDPKAFSAGIAFCATTGIAGTGAPAATTYVLNVDYK